MKGETLVTKTNNFYIASDSGLEVYMKWNECFQSHKYPQACKSFSSEQQFMWWGMWRRQTSSVLSKYPGTQCYKLLISLSTVGSESFYSFHSITVGNKQNKFHSTTRNETGLKDVNFLLVKIIHWSVVESN